MSGFRIAYEDEHLLVVDKGPGVVVHPSRGHAEGTLAQLLADIKAHAQVALFEVEPDVRLTGEVQTPAYDRATDLAPLGAAMTEAQRALDKSMCAAIRSALLFADRMISPMGPGEVGDWLHAWRAHKRLPDLVQKVQEVDDYTTIPGDHHFTQGGLRI